MREELTINKLIDIENYLHSVPLCKESEVDPDPDIDVNYFRGNYLCFPNYPNAHMYPGWNKDARDTFRKLYSQAGNTHLPMAIYGDYAGVRYDYTDRLTEFTELLLELKESKIEPVLFVVTDAVNQQTVVTPANAQEFCDSILPRFRGIVNQVCLGWELNQVSSWNTDNSGHDMIELSKYIRWNLPLVKINLHLQPNWWGPHYSAGNEWDFWRDAREINQLLFQIRPNSPITLTGDPENPDGLYLALVYPHSSGAAGVCGRMIELDKEFVMFEHSKNDLDRWKQVKTIIMADTRVKGWC